MMNQTLDFDFNEELEAPASASTETKPTTKKSHTKERDTMNQNTYTLTEKQFKVLQYLTKECCQYLELEEATTTNKRSRGAANQPKKSEMDEVFEQLMKVTNALREDYINNLMN